MVSLTLLAALVLAQEPAAWRSLGTTDGIQLEVRNVPGSSFEEIKASVVSPASVEQLCSAAFAKGQRKLDGKVKQKEILRETDREQWMYERVAIPVVSDRDYVIHIRIEVPASSGRCVLQFETVEDASRPPVPGVVRIPDIHGRWTVTPTAEGKSLLTYVNFCDPGGNVSPFLAKGGQRQAAVDLVRVILARAAALP